MPTLCQITLILHDEALSQYLKLSGIDLAAIESLIIRPGKYACIVAILHRLEDKGAPLPSSYALVQGNTSWSNHLLSDTWASSASVCVQDNKI